MASDTANNQSVERAIAVLLAFNRGGPELRMSDVCEVTGLGTSTASRMLSTLESFGCVERDEMSGLYRLGPTLITLGGNALNQSPVYREARQAAQDLACELSLGVNVAVRRDAALFYLLNFEGRLAPRSFTLSGQRNPLHATGLGKCLLAGLPAADRRALLPDEELHAFTSRTLTTHEALDDELRRLGENGYVLEVEELALGRACVAAPIRDRNGAVVAAMSISGPLSAIDLERRESELAGRVIEATDLISVKLGYVGPRHGLPSRKVTAG
jgi:DNA-binding IclR family transcriptional regulator